MLNKMSLRRKTHSKEIIFFFHSFKKLMRVAAYLWLQF